MDQIPSQSNSHSFVSKKTLLLIVVLGIITVGLIVWAITTPPYQKQETVIHPTPTPFATSMLSFHQSTGSSQTLFGTKTYTIDLTNTNHTINAVQLELGFDPKTITNVGIAPGPFFPKPVTLVKDIDYVNGRISYAIGISPTDTGINESGTVATLTFTVTPAQLAASGSSTTIYFLPKTIVSASGITRSVLKNSQPLVLPLINSTPSAFPSSTLQK